MWRHPGVPEPLRGTFAGLAHPAAIEYLLDLGVTSVELLPTHQFFDDGFLLERGLRNYWGYNSIGYFAPAQRVRRGRIAGAAGRRVQGHGQGAPRRRSRGHPRRRLQPHGRGRPPRTDPFVAGLRQRGLLPPPARRPRAATSTTRALATRSTCWSRTCSSSSRTACATGSRTCTSTASASTLRPPSRASPRRRSAVGLLRHHPAGPRHPNREAHRRALGRRGGWLPGRQLPGSLVGMERALPRHRARRLARPTGHSWPTSGAASPAARTSTRPTAGVRTRASTSSPRMTASRWPTSSATTASTTSQRRGRP